MLHITFSMNMLHIIVVIVHATCNFFPMSMLHIIVFIVHATYNFITEHAAYSFYPWSCYILFLLFMLHRTFINVHAGAARSGPPFVPFRLWKAPPDRPPWNVHPLLPHADVQLGPSAMDVDYVPSRCWAWTICYGCGLRPICNACWQRHAQRILGSACHHE